MQFVSHLIAQFGPWLWFALAVVLMVLETMVPGIHFLWFGMSAAVVGALALTVPMAWPWQIIAFALISLASVFWVRRYAREEGSKSDEPVLNVRAAQYIGRKVEVVVAIRNGRGKVRVGDTVWVAEGEDAAQGAEVRVTGVNGTVLIVGPLA
ncbi:MAG TPA: NfeD family protein [Hyphomicrobium sp.]|nr:NfeD family protein [Hyphomicrobium sp.]